MWHPTPKPRERWLKQCGKDRFSFEEALYAQTFPNNWLFPPQTAKRWKWLAEALPPKVAEYLFSTYVKGSNLVLLDLFADIGGWSLGAVWSRKFKKIIMVEKDAEKCRYLKLNFELSTPLWKFPILVLFKNLLSLSIKIFMIVVRTILRSSHSQTMTVLMRKS